MPNLYANQKQTVSIVQIFTGIAILVYWLLFFTIGLAPANPPECYFPFEHAFPLPDSILAIALIASGVQAQKGGGRGRDTSLICAGCLLFLGVLDMSFTAQIGGFGGPVGEALQSAVISFWCVGVGLWMIAVHTATANSATSSET